MNAIELTDEVYAELTGLPFSRKANFLLEVGSVNASLLSEQALKAVRTFPVIGVDSDDDLMGIDFLDGDQQFYIFKNLELVQVDQTNYREHEHLYLVDTQGYNYPRYIIELLGLDLV